MLITSESADSQYELAVVGGGLCGLIAATLAARSGCSVILFEQAKQLGGRASTTEKRDVKFNLGPRALYQSGDAMRLLRELDVPFHGAVPNPGVALATCRGRKHLLPQNFKSLISTRLLTLRDKWRLSAFLRRLPTLKTEQLRQTSSAQWFAENYGDGTLTSLLLTLVRLSTYAADMNRLSAGDAIDQLRLALEGSVLYIDGGWQSLIEGLRARAVALGVQIRSGAAVRSVLRDENGVTLTLSDGSVEETPTAILAVGPREVCELLQLPLDHPFVERTKTLKPVRAACLDVALTQLPCPNNRFALGLDNSCYFSVHSAAARLAPAGVAVTHVLKYLTADNDTPAKEVEAELEDWLELLQPGWRNHVVTRRTLPSMTVSHALPEAGFGGIAGRPGVDSLGIPGLRIAGDWVGPRGQIADASAASAEEAVSSLLTKTSHDRARLREHV